MSLFAFSSFAEDDTPSLELFQASIISGKLLDWKPLTNNAKHNNHDEPFCFCNGHYEEPKNLSPDSEMDPRYAPLRLSADKSEYETGESNLTFKGNIIGFQGSLQLFADELTYDKSSQEVNLSGNVQLREPGTLILGNEAMLNRKDGAAQFKEAKFVVHSSGANGVATAINRTPDEQISMHDASYSLCIPGKETWKIKAEDITLDTKNNEGVSRHARLFIKGVPVFYLPYFNFPLNNKRKSGLLFPSYSTGSQGTDLAVPYYLNLAENYDATITPRIVSEHGSLLEVQARYLNSNNEIVAGISYLPNEKDQSINRNSRWLASFKEKGHFDSAKRWTHEVDFQRVSDSQYLTDLGTTGLDVRRETQLKSNASVAYQAANWDTRLYIENHQALQNNLTDSHKRLPQISFNYYKAILPNINADITSEYTYFDHPDRKNNAAGDRVFIEPSVTFKKRTISQTTEAKIGLKQITHNLNSNPTSLENSNTFSANLKLDSKFFFEKKLSNGHRQTLEPRVQYYYASGNSQDNAPIFDTNRRSDSYHQLYNEERFSGHDRISDSNRITIGASSKQFNTLNEQLIEAGIAQQFHFSNRKVSHLNSSTANAIQLADENKRMRRDTSNTAFFVNVNPNKKLQVNTEYLFDSTKARFESASIHAHYTPNENNNQIFNAGYQYEKDVNTFLSNPSLKNDIHQVNASAIIKAKQNIYLIAQANYDLSNHESREELIGIEYNGCCWKARVAYHKEEIVNTSPNASDIKHTNAIRMEIQLKGLSGISDNISNILSESIEGFDTREKNFN